MTGEWSFLDSTPRYTRNRLTLREDRWRLPDGKDAVYPILAIGVTVGVLGFVDDARIVVVGQYRHLWREYSWELPGGGALPGETPEAAAPRELREEGGDRAERLTFLTRCYPSNAYLAEVADCDVGHGVTPDPLPADSDEFLERRLLPIEEAIRMALGGEITESVSKVALLQYAATRTR